MARRLAPALTLLCVVAAPALAAPDDAVEAHRQAHDLLVSGDAKGAAEKLGRLVESSPGIAGARLALARCLAGLPDAEAGVRILRDRTNDPVALAWCEVLVQLVSFQSKAAALERPLETVDTRAKEWGALVDAQRDLRKELALAEAGAVASQDVTQRLITNAVERAHYARVALEELGGSSDQARMETRLWWTARRDILLRLRDALSCEQLQGEKVEAERKAVRAQLEEAVGYIGSRALGELLASALESGLGWSFSERRPSTSEEYLAGYRRALEHQGLGPTDLELRLHHASLERHHLEQARQLAASLERLAKQTEELAEEAAMQWLAGGAGRSRDTLNGLRREVAHTLMALDATAVRLVEAEASARRPTTR